MEVRKIQPEIGAEIRGVDVKSMSEAEWQQIYQTWLDSNVICIKDQELEIEDFLKYSKRFGPVEPHPSKSTRHPDYPDITVLGVGKFDEDGTLNMAVYRRGADCYHTDGAYDPIPFKATQLYALAIPSRGGDTRFASMYSAYNALPNKLKERIANLRGAYRYGGRTGRTALIDEETLSKPPVLHPLVRVHPETGRKGLYFDPGKILSIEGMDEAEGDELIDELETYMIQPQGQFDHKWSVGDIVIWDNRCSYHQAAGDYPPDEDRIHWRVSIKEPGS